MLPYSVQYEPTKDFRKQLKSSFSSELIRLWDRFRITKDVLVSVQASAGHHSTPQETYLDPGMYSAFEVVVYKRDATTKAFQALMQVQYLKTELVQRLLTDIATDFGRIELSPLRPIEGRSIIFDVETDK